MSIANVSMKHGRTLEEARTELAAAVRDVEARFGPLIRQTRWSADRSAVTLTGTGFEAELRVDAQEVHATLNLPLLVGLFQGQLVSGVKGILEHTFQKPALSDRTR
jgi:hypothetical protein